MSLAVDLLWLFPNLSVQNIESNFLVLLADVITCSYEVIRTSVDIFI